ncbi:hypothetical protein KOW79_001986 [Hemibagrus wyckioides]|uniref:Uncharacterized protein n=1 Tax=Hemibagrus wyckioides TaxID=337641 RepID=A0A9D3SUG1_9TELE|nr:hypothetical protein KOW79_001986 [Hemibagrus wyckioides]
MSLRITLQSRNQYSGSEHGVSEGYKAAESSGDSSSSVLLCKHIQSVSVSQKLLLRSQALAPRQLVRYEVLAVIDEAIKGQLVHYG